jgi:hypothetical protein
MKKHCINIEVYNMSRTTNNQELLASAIPENIGITCITKHPEQSNLISAENDRLCVMNGYKIAIIDENGNVVKQGVSVEKDVFDAMTAQVIETFCKRFKGFTENDFN